LHPAIQPLLKRLSLSAQPFFKTLHTSFERLRLITQALFKTLHTNDKTLLKLF